MKPQASRSEAYWKALNEISRLFNIALFGDGSAAQLQRYRRERATIWRRYGLTYRAFHYPARRIGRVRRGRI